ncbi:MAG: hypothetical protein ABIQ12_12390 [Opitutaceae bacterium]
MQKNSRAFVNQLVICLLVAMLASGSIGVGTVWLRHQNSMTAKANSALVARLAQIERRSDELKTLIQGEMRPELLRRRNVSMRLDLVPMNELLIFQVRENIIERMGERAYRGLISDAPAVPVVTLKLAQH